MVIKPVPEGTSRILVTPDTIGEVVLTGTIGEGRGGYLICSTLSPRANKWLLHGTLPSAGVWYILVKNFGTILGTYFTIEADTFRSRPLIILWSCSLNISVQLTVSFICEGG